MVFASFVFLFWFLPLFLAAYYLLPLRAKNLWLTLASYAFYGWWKPQYCGLMLLITLIDFSIGLAMGAKGSKDDTTRRRYLVISIVSNLALLAWFKYANLLVDSMNTLLTWSQQSPVPWDAIVLPVGISFFTFQSMSYTIDVYKGEVQPTRSLLDFACYVAMFPQLVAGPIVRYRDVDRELVHREHSYMLFSSGVFLVMIGFTKKILLADNCALICDPVFAQGQLGLLPSWIGTTAYAAQIYFDFSGYSDMAIGLGWMLGFQFPVNFDSPYQSESITEFWRRWHMSLSTWLRDYLYIPLGGNRLGEGRTYANLMATMLLGGLWHGASWTFLLWGGYQGLFLAFERRAGRRPWYAAWPRFARRLATFVIVLGGWAIFRADSLGTLGTIYGGMFGLHGLGAIPWPALHAKIAWLALPTALALAFWSPNSLRLVARFHPAVMLGVIAAFVLALGQFFTREYSPFIYFQF